MIEGFRFQEAITGGQSSCFTVWLTGEAARAGAGGRCADPRLLLLCLGLRGALGGGPRAPQTKFPRCNRYSPLVSPQPRVPALQTQLLGTLGTPPGPRREGSGSGL